jgi:phosphoribosylformimino-5-aminoimidazole carboxamide ribotide isomerase
MLILPAIDLKDGKCVRLRQGRASDVTVYADDPVEMAHHWVSLGAQYLHVVDLDGAFQGHPVHTEVIARIAAAIPIPMEIGGGLREDDHVAALIDCGVDRAIVGTRALAEPEALERLAGRFGSHVAVGIDARGGFVQVKGWVETTEVRAVDLAQRVDKAGIQTIIYTDTATDGMLQGTNVPAISEVANAVDCGVVASGGISSTGDIEALVALQRPNIVGAIVGKALYEGSVSLPDMVRATGA